jgi:hypothetical protein
LTEGRQRKMHGCAREDCSGLGKNMRRRMLRDGREPTYGERHKFQRNIFFHGWSENPKPDLR